MTEQEWFACEDPAAMLARLRQYDSSSHDPARAHGRNLISDRKLRLFACACCHLYKQEKECREWLSDWEGDQQSALEGRPHLAAAETWVVNCDGKEGEVAALLREVAGNPFRPVKNWKPYPYFLDAELDGLAQAAYDERRTSCPCVYAKKFDRNCQRCHGTGNVGTLDPFRLAVLADALEEAGCIDESILAHLRSPGPHVRGCWAVDAVLGLK